MTARNLMITGLLGGLLATLGCGAKPKPSMNAREAWLWDGDEEVDPAGDLAKLQGKWSRIPQGEGALRWPDVFLIIEGHIATYDYTKFPKSSGMLDNEKFRFILNSDRAQKAIRFTESLGPNRFSKKLGPSPIAWEFPEYNRRYKLENDILTMWTYWGEIGEQPKYQYERVKTAK